MQALHAAAVLCDGGHDIKAHGVDAAVPQNVGQLGDVLFQRVEGTREQVAQVFTFRQLLFLRAVRLLLHFQLLEAAVRPAEEGKETAQAGQRRIVRRCISRLDYGKQYCADSITVPEPALQAAIVRAVNRFSSENEATCLTLMKATIGDAIGLNGGSNEIDLLNRRIDAITTVL